MAPPLPRWLLPRASRLAAALVEASVDAVGHAPTLARLGSRDDALALGGLCGLPRSHPERFQHLIAALARGVDQERLGLLVDRERGTVGVARSAGVVRALLGGEAGLSSGWRGARIEQLPTSPRPPRREGPPAPVIPFPTRKRRKGAAAETSSPGPVDGARLAWRGLRLGAAQHVAVAPLLPPLDKVAREPGFGPRTVRALALCASWVKRGAGPDPDLAYFALGEVGGDPQVVPLAVYDRALAALEAMLHRSSPERERVAPLLALADKLDELTGQAPPTPLDRLAARDARRAPDLLLLGRGATGSAPALLRSPRRVVRRDPDSYVPARREPRPLPALDGQGDLFGP